MLEIQTKLREAISILKNNAPLYAALSDEDKKSVRNHLYKQEGMFAKIICQGDKSPLEQMVQASKNLK